MADRRYSEEEVATIFERAATARHVARRQIAAGSGLTLAELKEIGQEVGITPEAVAEAANSLDRADPRSVARYFMGFPIGVGKTVELARPLSEAEWEHLVVDLRETFDARGRTQAQGSLRQWTNGNLQALLEPTPTGQRLRLRTLKGNSRGLMTAGIAVLGMAAVTFVVTAVAGGMGDPGFLRSMGILSLSGAGMFAAGALRVPSWAETRLRQMDAVAARLARITSSAPELPPGAT
jgi:hypothetical protein